MRGGASIIKKRCLFSAIWILASAFFAGSSYSQQIKLGADYLYEKNKQTGDSFVQTYDVILQKRLNPLYDVKLKFQLRSEHGYEDEDRKQTLPALSLHLGNRLVSLNSGYSEDSIHEEDKKYDVTRGYTTLIWCPSPWPRFTVQYQAEEKDLDDGNNTEKRLILRDDYKISFGIFQFNQSLTWEKKSLWDPNSGRRDYDNHDLHNRGRIDYQTSALDERLQLHTQYELTHHEKEDEDEDYRSVEQKVDFRLHGIPSRQARVTYNALWGELRKQPDDERRINFGNSLKTELLPFQYLRTNLDVSYDKSWETLETKNDTTSMLTYGLKIEPKIPGLLFNPDIPMAPVSTSLLLSSTLHKINGEPYRMYSASLEGAAELYRGFELRTDFEINHKKGYDGSETLMETIMVDAKLDLRDDLTYYFRNENEWTPRYKQEGLPNERKFQGEVWHLITYRPIDQFFLTFDNKLKYGDIDKFFHNYRIEWAPAPKWRLEARYQSENLGGDKSFSSEVNINLTKTLRLRIKYTYPTEDEIISLRFTIKT
ncbi:MAG: hypothetical protein ACMUIA_01120 [bacterium]